jgi:TolB-like protein/tetratricopeptide (TPR) repeat protein
MEGVDPAVWRRTKDLFLAALDVPPGQRDAFLTSACGTDQVLRNDVASLLASDADAGSFIDRPAAALLAHAGPRPFTPRLAPGGVLGRYEIVQFLGAGGIGEVYRARDTRLDRAVAIKLVSDPGDTQAGQRLLQEAQHASRLGHPNICGVHEVEDVDGLPFIVLEFVEGDTLREVIRRSAPSAGDVVRWATQIAAALDHAHRRGIIHRDLKPSNVVLTPEQQVKVLDFGLSRRVEPGVGTTSPASILSDASVAGTLTHIAPEVLRGQPVDARADLWALGVMLYEMVCGVVPFSGTTPFETANAILHQAPRPLPADIHPGLRRVIDRCLAKDSTQRFQSAAALTEALDAIDVEISGPTAGRAGWPSPRRRAAAAALIVAALAGVYVTGVWRTAPAGPVAHVLAVLPFDDTSVPGSAGEPFFAAGLAEGLTAELGRIETVRVISSATTTRYQHRPDALADLVRDTGASHVVRGAVSRVGGGVRIAAELLEPATGRVIWSESYERPVRTLQALHGTIATAISRAMAVELAEDDRTRFSTARAVAPEVYEAYLKGRYHWNQRTDESLRAAVAEFQTALTLDPTYAPAYAALADCYNLLGTVMVGGGSPQQWRPRAAEAAIQALQIDPGLAEAHATLGYVRHYNWEWADAEQSLRRAIELNPSNALAHVWYANLLSSRLRLDEAIREVNLARDLDPLSLVVNTNVGWVLFMARRNDEAIAQYVKTLQLNPGYVQAHTRLADAYGRANRHRDAIEELTTAVRLTKDSASSRVALAQVSALAGDAADAERLLNRALQERDDKYVSPGAIANAYVALGQDDKAFDWLEQAFRERANNVAYLAVEPLYDRIRQAPRFRALLSAVGLP